MFDLKQLDNLFNDNSLKKQISAKEAALQRQRKQMRIIKICFPAVAAALIGLLAIFPSLQERDEFSIQISKPTRQDLEKLHMENTVLYVTDKANRVNSFTAENIEGLYPCGEGAGYAGGITSAAVDGLRCAMAVMRKYSPIDI